ncbi:MAG TPA: GxxExxY protein [Holophagaceae bacterium]|nr:GxxExxY protein [Holophagaceae bacterium]
MARIETIYGKEDPAWIVPSRWGEFVKMGLANNRMNRMDRIQGRTEPDGIAQFEELTGAILGVAFDVSNELGAGFLESVYEGALVVALNQKGISVERQVPMKVRFRDVVVGHFVADLWVEGKVIVELKAVSRLTSEHKAQTINYLKATGTDLGLLLNFGNPKLEYHRLHR